MTDLVLTDVREGVATVTLNNPTKLNAFADDMRERLSAALDWIAADSSVRVLVITGAGRGFCAGGDISFMVELKKRDAGYEELHPLLEAGRAAIERIERLPYPVIAAVNGPAAGAGMNLALACDLRIASDKASFGETFARIGLHLDWGGSWTLPRLVGLGKAMELAWLADIIGATEALRIGLVHRVVPHEQFDAEVQKLAERLARAPQTSVRHAKRNLRAAFDRTLEQALEAEIESQRACWDAADSAEGIRAFVEKRPAQFGGASRADELAAAGRRFE